MRVLFLDIDGVLNFQSYIIQHANGGSSLSCEIVDPECVARVSTICAATDAKVVISSSWRILMEQDRLVAFLERNGFRGEVIGYTPSISKNGRIRGDEIQAWLDHSVPEGETVEAFVILDDDSDMGKLLPRLVKTSFEVGLRDEHVSKAIALLLSV